MTDCLKIDYNIQENIKGLKIPPMILFLLAENSFKHGSSLDAGTPWIRIFVGTEPEKIILLAENSKPKTVLKQESDFERGKGFKSLKERLDIIYKPKGYKLKIEDKDTFFSVKLVLKEKIEFRQNTYR